MAEQARSPDETAEQTAEESGSEATVLSLEEACALLAQAEVVGCQGLPWGSNYTYALALQVDDGPQVLGIYKPRKGEVPLWDFPDGTLYRRERAAYLLARALEWDFVPPTVIRDGPYGIGSVQLYIEPDPRSSYNQFLSAHADAVKRIALFDCVANNADRKAGHFLLGRADGRLWGIDHGLTFNTQPKLRTVVWEFTDDPIPNELLRDLAALRLDSDRMERLLAELDPLLADDELVALTRRIEHVLETRVYPSPRSHRSYPWPPF